MGVLYVFIRHTVLYVPRVLANSTSYYVYHCVCVSVSCTNTAKHNKIIPIRTKAVYRIYYTSYEILYRPYIVMK